MENKVTLKIFLASPMDLEKERALFRDVIDSINKNEAAAQNAELQLICWENNTRPGLNEDAQAVVNSQLRGDYDVFVCMFRDRVGTPTNRTISGTVEEYERARLKKLKNEDLEIMAYFFSSENAGQDITDLKIKMGSKDGDGAMFCDVKDSIDFEIKVRQHLCDALGKHIERLEEQKRKATNIKVNNAASVAFVCDSSVLLLQRSDDSQHGAGTWQLPGGKSEADETPEQTAVREVKEEISYAIKKPEALIKVKTFIDDSESHPGSVLNMTLFIYKADKKFKPKLNKESKGYEWVSLNCCEFGGKRLFQMNRQMLKAVWLELYLNRPLKVILDSMDDSSDSGLPHEVVKVSEHDLNSVYAMLAFLGIVNVNNELKLESPTYGKTLLKEFTAMIADGEKLFRNDGSILPNKSIKLSADAIDELSEIRAKAFCSNQKLVTHLSCDTRIDHSVRNVCDTLIFGKYGQKKYILLRWDFFANKYQFVGSGLENVSTDSENDMIAKVMNKRFPAMRRYFDYVFITEYSAYHFSAGSVDNDPILRNYNIKMSVLLPNNRSDTADICNIISAINKTTESKISASHVIDNSLAKNLNYFVWCELDELLLNPAFYRGRKVSGFRDLKEALAENKIRHLTDNLLTTLDLPFDPHSDDDNLSIYKRIYDDKRVSDTKQK
ncbi:MAG: NUDIX domain-containing protein [Ruminococcaceae bacterium]|nr:NUDIX domain-containing protein [Oscillospiraceae bacterium]